MPALREAMLLAHLMNEAESYEFPKPSRVVLDIGGDPTEVVEVKRAPRAGTRFDLDVVVFPGNPGSALFYSGYMKHVHRVFHASGRSVRLRCVSHLGHARHVYGSGRWSLADQVDHKRRYLERELAEVDSDKLLIVGHSIGGYMAIEAVKRCTASMEKAKVLAMMPYLAFDIRSSKQRMLRAVAQRPAIPALFAGTLGLFPGFIRRPLVRASDPKLETEAVSIVADAMCYSVIHNCFSLARSEFASLPRNARAVDWTWMRRNADRLGFVYAPDDHWAPEKHMAAVQKEVPEAWLQYDEKLCHGFVTQDKACQRMARLTKTFWES